jgi:hypothetical protein
MTPSEFLSALIVFTIRTHASVTSYGRTSQHNADVGGVPQSAHMYWVAADVVYDGAVPIEYRRECAQRLGLNLIDEGDHDHLQPAGWRAG